jgi:cytochrome c biogenesis protein CcmG, thiol:disulfide interchange protein DsbE
MKVVRKIANWTILGCFVLALVAFIMPTYRQGEPSVGGKKAEDFALTLGGRPAHLSDLKGKVIVLNFWASYCGSCVEELPSLDHLQQRITSRGGVVLGISIDEDPAAYEKFLIEHPVAFSTYYEPTKRVSLAYGTSMIPETYVIDRQGRLARKIIGPQRWDSEEMLGYFETALSQN